MSECLYVFVDGGFIRWEMIIKVIVKEYMMCEVQIVFLIDMVVDVV